MTWRKMHRNRRKQQFGRYGSRKIVRIGSILLDLRNETFNFKITAGPLYQQGWTISLPVTTEIFTTRL